MSFSFMGMWPFLVQFVISDCGCESHDHISRASSWAFTHSLYQGLPLQSSEVTANELRNSNKAKNCYGVFSLIKTQPKANLLKPNPRQICLRAFTAGTLRYRLSYLVIGQTLNFY